MSGNVEAIKNLLSIAEIGSAISVFLFGVYTVQLYLYYSHFPNDRWQLKALVGTPRSSSVWSAEHCL